MAELQTLINNVDAGLNSRATFLKKIAHPQLFLASLRELASIVGNDKLKNSFASQISYLLTQKRFDSKHPVMLNTIIYGPPGVGKTKLGGQMAKVWYSLGYLKKPVRTKTITENIKSVDPQNFSLWIIVFIIVWSLLGMMGSLVVKACNMIGTYYVVMIVVVIATIAFLAWAFSSNSSSRSYTDVNKAANVEEEEIAPEDVVEKDIFVVATRADFVDKYVGWSDKKTKALLEANLGKVLLIDEAYQLLNGEQDSFGHEALNTLNQFLSEHPNEIVVIFAGYKDRLQEGIFTAQPGLPRRCMWHFECQPYTPAELFEIFKTQLNEESWKLRDEVNSRQLFVDNNDAFPNSGGDTERLAFYAKIEFSKDFMAATGRSKAIDQRQPSKYITTSQLERAINVLRDNNIHKDRTASEEPSLTDIVEAFRKRK